MKVTHVALGPTEASEAAGRPTLTPELLAATGARYSRSNEGLEAILAKIDPSRRDQSVDSIFRMVDYGHASIADMAPVAMFMDGISMWLAYQVWTQVPTASGQESSTRYLKMTAEDLLPPEDLGIPEHAHTRYAVLLRDALRAYETTLAAWMEFAEAHPSVMRIPEELLRDPSERAQKQVARMRRNYAFDRARVFLPVALRTNVMLVMSARGWVSLCQWLLSHPTREALHLGAAIRDELALAAPRLIKHAVATAGYSSSHALAVQEAQAFSRSKEVASGEVVDHPNLSVHLPAGVCGADLATALAFHDHRYAPVGSALQRTLVRFRWDAISIGEIRDLNRHRTGTKHCQAVPVGFYAARDQAPAESAPARVITRLAPLGDALNAMAREALERGDLTWPYHLLLGAQLPFEHATTGDKFVYEAELRTGVGAHYRYAKHLADVLKLWYARFPETRGMIHEGSAEPE